MFDTLLIGTSGLLGHAKGLRVVGNNLSNVNTAGFKSSQLQFGNLFENNATNNKTVISKTLTNSFGTGLDTLGSKINFQAGLEQRTGSPLNVIINGNGFFVVKRDGQELYTRSGDFRFDDEGVLVTTSGEKVQSLTGSTLAEISLAGLTRNPAKTTTEVKLGGNLAYVAPPAVTGIDLHDANGTTTQHSIEFAPANGDASTQPTSYNVTLKRGATVLGTTAMAVVSGFPTQTTVVIGTVTIDVAAVRVTNTPGAAGVSMISQNGYATGLLRDQTIGNDGVLSLNYSNGQVVKGPTLAMANFNTDQDLEQLSGSFFTKKAGVATQYGQAKDGYFGSLTNGRLEGSNVDLAAEFGNLILMQRGYQASSHVISTANDMIQALFDMKGR